MNSGEPLLQIKNLDITFEPKAHAVRSLNLKIDKSQIHGLVGESGSGKSVTSTAIMGLLPEPPAKINEGQIIFKGRDILRLKSEDKRKIRGREIAMVFQEPAKYLNPSLKIGEQIREALSLHFGIARKPALERSFELLSMVGLGESRRVLDSFPHELSGGMKQRAMIAMGIACNPSLLIADEPTTALDVTLQLQILKLISDLQSRLKMSILFISHDLNVVKQIANRVSVIYAGKIVESADKNTIFKNPLHPYTQLLLLSIPDPEKRGKPLRAIPGTVPDAESIPSGCAFHTRCPYAMEICSKEVPPLKEYKPEHYAACHLLEERAG